MGIIEMQEQIRYIGYGSPIMDAISDIDEGLLKKYNLKLNETIHMSIEDSKIIEAFSENSQIELVPGGCSYNTMRVLNWMISPSDKRGSVGVIGSVGDDTYGQTYSDLLGQENIQSIFEKYPDNNTAICGVFCHGKDRGHVTDLGVSTQISDEFVEANWERFKAAQLVFTELFIIKHKKETVYKLAELGSQDEKIFGFNLPSFYFIETYLEDIKNLIEYADIIFVNAEESIFFAKMMGLETHDFGLISEFMAKHPKKNLLKRRTVVITCGPNPAYCCEFDHMTNEVCFTGAFEPDTVEEEAIIDTNAAGDAFAGGFLSQYMPGKSLDQCMKAGHWAAALVIQRRGCQYPIELISIKIVDNYYNIFF